MRVKKTPPNVARVIVGNWNGFFSLFWGNSIIHQCFEKRGPQKCVVVIQQNYNCLTNCWIHCTKRQDNIIASIVSVSFDQNQDNQMTAHSNFDPMTTKSVISWWFDQSFHISRIVIYMAAWSWSFHLKSRID